MRVGLNQMYTFDLRVGLLGSLTSLLAGLRGKLPDMGRALLSALGQRL